VDCNKALVSFATAKKFDKANEAEQAVQPERRFGRVQKSKALDRRRVNLVVRSFAKDVFPFTVTMLTHGGVLVTDTATGEIWFGESSTNRDSWQQMKRPPIKSPQPRDFAGG
jgi:hypothetical protein